jgi:hypothetical protein
MVKPVEFQRILYATKFVVLAFKKFTSRAFLWFLEQTVLNVLTGIFYNSDARNKLNVGV